MSTPPAPSLTVSEKRKHEQKDKAAKGVIQLNEDDLEDAEKTRE